MPQLRPAKHPNKLRSRARTRLVTIILVVQAAAVITYVLVNNDLGDRAVIEQMDQILDTAIESAGIEVDRYIADVNRATSEVLFAESSRDTNSMDLELALFNALRYVPHLAGAYVGAGDGSFNYVFRTEDGYGTKRIVVKDDASVVTRTERSEEFELELTEELPDDEYDPSVRPWFIGAVDAATDPVWTDTYTFFTSQQPGITRAATISDGSMTRVAGVDVELSTLVDLVDRLSQRASGEVYLKTHDGHFLTRRGYVEVAPEQTLEVDHVGERVLAVEHALNADRADDVHLEFEGESHVIASKPIDFGDRSWTMVIDLAESEVAAPVTGVVGTQRVLALGVGGLAGLLMALLFLPATEPITRLELDSRTDSLTRLPNRREILRRGEQMAERNDAYSVAMIDVDRFKAVNDRFGHAVGDDVLRSVAEMLVDGGAEVGRLGGEEFVVLFESGSVHRQLAIIERLRKRIAGCPIVVGEQVIDVTISAGFIARSAEQTFSEVLAAADAALYRAKRLGRNRVVEGPVDAMLADEVAVSIGDLELLG